MPGAEVVDRELEAGGAQLLGERLPASRVGAERGLGDLDDQPVADEIELGHRRQQIAHEPGLPERRREIERDREIEPLALPLGRLPARLARDPVRDRRDQAVALRVRDALSR